MEQAGAIFDAPGSEERKPRKMAKFRGGHNEASAAMKERYPYHIHTFHSKASNFS